MVIQRTVFSRLRLALSCALLLLVFAGVAQGQALLDQRAFASAERAWQPIAARPAVQPECAVDPRVSHTGQDGSLRVGCRRAIEYGGWVRTVDGVTAGTWYRFDAYYRAEKMVNEARTVVARLDWRGADGERTGPPDYVYHAEALADGWRHIWSLAPAPENTRTVRIDLQSGWRPGGTVWWDELKLAAAAPPAPRHVRIATLHHAAQGNTSAQQNVDEYCTWIDRAAKSKPDVIVLPEAMTAVGTGLTYAQVAEPIPGPTSARLGEKARQYHCYIEACYDERDGEGVYNTAILIDREGKIVGKYRKTYVPREEIEAGITPGDAYPVFDTDFGRVGMMICWDVHYVEPTQQLALNGAEIVLLPIWDGYESLMKARAIENHVFLVTCAYGNQSWIVDPNGEVVATTADEAGKEIAVADVDLSHRYLDGWLGDMRARFFKEHREDLRKDTSGGLPR
jgi:predicted amidohydrolase